MNKPLKCNHVKRDGTVCGHTWHPRREMYPGRTNPIRCPKCTSFRWNQPKGAKA